MAPLADASRLTEVPVETWRAFGKRLHQIGVQQKAVRPIFSIGAQWLTPALASPMRKWEARRQGGDAATMIRVLALGDAVPEEAARAALGKSLWASLEGAGLFAAQGGTVSSPFRLSFINDLLILGDDTGPGADTVMGPGGSTTILLVAAHPRERVESLLDLGCGAGTFALAFAKGAGRVVGTDINERAVLLARINAAINGLSNVEFRVGDGFQPVAGETFDRVVCQPPFVPRPDDAAAATYLFGGRRGDELALALLADLPAHLSAKPGARGLFLVEWPIAGDEPLEKRVRAAVRSNKHHVLLLAGPECDLDGYATSYAAHEHPQLGEEFERTAMSRRDHLAKLGIRTLRMTLNVIERAADGEPAWTSTVDVPSIVDVTGGRVDRIVEARRLHAAGKSALIDARLRLPEGAAFVREHAPGEESDAVLLTLPPEALVEPVTLNEPLAKLLELVHESDSVRDAAAVVAEKSGTSLDTAIGKVLPPVKDALIHGMLEIAPR